jgi:hypothetical protein
MVFNWLFGTKTPKPEPVKEEAYGIDFRNSELPAEHKWKKWDKTNKNQAVTGVTHRLDEVEWFIGGAILAEEKGQGRYGIHLIREPSNPYDENAIQVWGWLNEPENKTQIGYLTKDEAKSIAKDLPPETPLSAELTRLFMPESKIPWIGIKILVPKIVKATKFNPATPMQKEFYKYFGLKLPKNLSYEDAEKFLYEQSSEMRDEWKAYEDIFEEINDPETRKDLYGIKKVSFSFYRSIIEELKKDGRALSELADDVDLVIDKAIELNPDIELKE